MPCFVLKYSHHLDGPENSMPEFVEVVIDNVRVSLMSQQRVVVLRQVDAEQYLPIWVGPYEAEAISVALQEIETARPLTHDLLKNVFTAFNAKIRRVEVVSLQNDIFYANIVAEVDGRELHIDARPSDAIALAVRVHVPILVEKSVLDAAGILPEKDIQEGEAPAASSAPEAPLPASPSEPGSDRLSIFEDFLDKLEHKEDDPDEPEEPKQP